MKKLFKQIRNDISKKIFSYDSKNNHKNITILGIKIHIKTKKNNKEGQLLNGYTNKINSTIEKIVPRTKLKLEIDIVEHCNLNCKGCDHFSPIAKQKYLDINIFVKDIKRIAELTRCGEDIEEFTLLGGEPLLHPDILEFITQSRILLPFAPISIITNAIYLPKMDEQFWINCCKNNILIRITKYPIKLDYDLIENTAKKHNVKLSFFNNTSILKTSYKIPLDLKGKQDPRLNFLNCHHANNCIFLRYGKIYTCTIAPNIHHFNEYYKTNIPLTDRDGIDIYKANNLNDILQFVSNPIPFCRFCNVKNRSYGHKWGISTKDINEWI